MALLYNRTGFLRCCLVYRRTGYARCSDARRDARTTFDALTIASGEAGTTIINSQFSILNSQLSTLNDRKPGYR
ncbi:MAG: hypothetical protein HC894_02210 [Microcoleus sp. SM1_3_4]|nr:hypothetical protein [Microcoleus sp. SM1_3_4]